MSVLTFKSEDYKKLPQFLKDYASYLAAIKGNSEKTVCEYLSDLRTFFRFYEMRKQGVDADEKEYEKIDIGHLTIDDARAVNTQLIINFLMYARSDRKNSTTTRMRKISSLKSFYHYACNKRHLVDVKPRRSMLPKKVRRFRHFLRLRNRCACLKRCEQIKNQKPQKEIIR